MKRWIRRMRWPLLVPALAGPAFAFELSGLYQSIFAWTDGGELDVAFGIMFLPLFLGIFALTMIFYMAIVCAATGLCRVIDRYAVMRHRAPEPVTGDAVVSMAVAAGCVMFPTPVFVLFRCVLFSSESVPGAFAGMCAVTGISFALCVPAAAIFAGVAALVSEIERRVWAKTHSEENGGLKHGQGY